jgi:hypothetical protein
MRSAYSPGGARITSSSTLQIDETYDLKGLNLTIPDQIMPKGESPYTINSRMYARADNETKVAMRTRKGSQIFSLAIGQTLNVQNVAASTGDAPITASLAQAQSFSPSVSGALTQLDLSIKKIGAAGGYIIVEIYTNNGGVPGDLLAQSSIVGSLVGTSYSYIPTYFMDAPYLDSGDDYWVVAYIQNNGIGTYYLNQTAPAGAISSSDDGNSWNSLGASLRYRTYLATKGAVKGFTRRYPQNGTNRTVVAHATSIYSIADSPATVTEIDSALDPLAAYTRFEQIDDKTIWVNGKNAARWWNGADPSSNISGIGGTPSHVVAHAGRLFMVDPSDPTKVFFSELYDFETWPSVNFFYVPNPKSPDHISALVVFQDNLVIFTHETKYIVFGSDISSFTMKQAVGTKGALSQEAIAVDRNYIYFVADDKMVYRFNGVSDQLISEKIEPELQAIQSDTSVRLHIYRNQVRIYYARSPNTTVDHMLLFDIIYEQWFMDTGRCVLGSIEFSLDSNELVEFSSRAGWMFYGERGYSDVGKPISFKYWTAYKAYGSGAAKDRIKRFRPILRPSSSSFTMSVGKDIDFNNTPDMRPYLVSGGGAKWGAFKWGDGTKWGGKRMIDTASAMSGRGKHTQYRFEMVGVETPVELYGYISQYKSGRPK